MGLFEGMFSNPETMGLLAAASGMLQAGGPSRTPVSLGQALGQGLGAGMQGYQSAIKAQSDAEERQAMADYRKAQIGQFQRKAAADAAQQAAIVRLRAKMEADPSYKPTAADLFEIDPESALKSMTGAVDFGLEPKIGINPETGKHGYFIQDKRGGTRWIGAGVPDNLKFIPGTDYLPPQTFNPRSGDVSPVRQFGVPQPASSGGGSVAIQPVPQGSPEPMPAIDALAPWARITSPKEQDDMKKRVYESDRKRLDDLMAQVSQGRSVMRDLERFGELNRQQETGGFLDRQSWIPTTDAEKREMEAIQARLAPAMRVPGSGTTSDRDIALYLQSLPGIDKEGNVNRNIREQFAKQLRDAEEQLAFREKYLTEKGHLVGVDEAFKRSKSGGEKTAPEAIDSNQPRITGIQERVNYLGGISDPAERASFSKAVTDSINSMQVDQQTKDAILSAWAAQSASAMPKPPMNLLAALPTANASNKGKTAIDHDTGKRYRSNGMQWVEVK